MGSFSLLWMSILTLFDHGRLIICTKVVNIMTRYESIQSVLTLAMISSIIWCMRTVQCVIYRLVNTNKQKLIVPNPFIYHQTMSKDIYGVVQQGKRWENLILLWLIIKKH